jgi:carbon monoxide dehydrogenase subunit G
MSTVTKSIDINVPIRTAYNQWTQFEEFPRFMDGVKSVTQIDDTRLHWVAEIAGRQKEWDAEISEQHPDERVAWTSTSGARNAGVVTFHRIDDDTTRVTVQMDVEPDGPIESIGDWAGILGRRIQGDMERFRDFIQGRGEPTGGRLTPSESEPEDEFVPAETREISDPRAARQLTGAAHRRAETRRAEVTDEPGSLIERGDATAPNARDGGYGSEMGLAADDPAYRMEERAMPAPGEMPQPPEPILGGDERHDPEDEHF